MRMMSTVSEIPGRAGRASRSGARDGFMAMRWVGENSVMAGPTRAQRLADVLRVEIKTGQWKQGAARTRAELASVHDESEYVVAGAVAILREEGLVESRRRVGSRRPCVQG